MTTSNISSHANNVGHFNFTDGQSMATAGAGVKGNHHQPPLASSFEEVAQTIQKSFETRGKPLNDRRILPRTMERVEKIEEIYNLLAADGENLDDLAEQALSRQKKGLQTKDMLDLAGGDPARADLILQQAIHRAMGSGDRDCLNELKQCRQDLHDLHGSEVRAGINTAHAIALFSQSPTQRQEVRNLYYNSILGKSSVANIADELLKKFGESDFNRAIHTLLRALAQDVASAAPSRPSGQLNTLYRDLCLCQRLSLVLKSCRDLCEKLVAKEFPLKATATDMARQLINFSQNNFYARDLKQLLEQFAGKNISHQLKFLNDFLAIVKEGLPITLWKDLNNRKSVIKMIGRQTAELIQQEGKMRAAV